MRPLVFDRFNYFVIALFHIFRAEFVEFTGLLVGVLLGLLDYLLSLHDPFFFDEVAIVSRRGHLYGRLTR